ncbi:chemotaxis protein CheB [Lentzea albida]|uniref:protein-glutamate methylesterase n=1 Tax=Lentzea albida TaxID=65499 RepID=A0A1H9WEM0_9PSEU|nr:chemotaxis protein CheB [Lentzea albida]SES32362.1 two-component system, chemotaxis family, response regulator CheB [Lentzea albida]
MHRDLVVAGASAGGVEALRSLVAGLPPDLPAAVVVVLHMPAGGSSALPAILDRSGPLSAVAVGDGTPLRHGRIHVAPPDHHTLVQNGVLRLSRGPTENGHRPAVNVLFRSAALSAGPAAIGVVLSGMLDDGVAGMAAIKNQGGLALVQSPGDALHPGMPVNVLEHVAVDHVVPASEMGATLAELVAEEITAAAPPVPETLRLEVEVSGDNAGAGFGDIPKLGRTTTLTCPDCAGSLLEIPGGSGHHRCLVGHAWTPEALLDAYSGGLERAMWTAVRTLEEKIALARRMAGHARQSGRAHIADRYSDQEEEALAAADVLRKHLLRSELREGTGS